MGMNLAVKVGGGGGMHDENKQGEWLGSRG